MDTGSRFQPNFLRSSDAAPNDCTASGHVRLGACEGSIPVHVITSIPSSAAIIPGWVGIIKGR